MPLMEFAEFDRRPILVAIPVRMEPGSPHSSTRT